MFWNTNGCCSPGRVLPPVPPGACVVWTHRIHDTLLLCGLVWVWCAHPREMVAVCFPVLGRPCFSNNFYQRTVSNWFGKGKKKKVDGANQWRPAAQETFVKTNMDTFYQPKSVVLLDFCLEAGIGCKFGVLPSSSVSLRHKEKVAMHATCEN